MINTYWTFGSLNYFIIIAITILILVTLYLVARNKSYQFKYRLVLGIAIFNFVLHFFKLFFSPYNIEFFMYNDLRVLRVIGFENICAVNTIVMPFIILSDNKILKDYLFYIGALGGLVAIIIPVDPYTKREFFSFDMIRYFMCHISLFICPLLMVLLNVHKISYKRAYYLPYMMLLCLFMIYVNECIMADLGWLSDASDNYYLNFINRRNFSFVFGPVESIGKIGKIFTCLAPNGFKVYPAFTREVVPSLVSSVLNQVSLVPRLSPLLWLIVPVIIYLTFYGYFIGILFDYKNFKNDFKNNKYILYLKNKFN